MTADPIARGVGLTLGVLLGLAVVLGMAGGALGQEGEPAWYDEPALPAEREPEPIWLYQLPAEPAPAADPDSPAEPAPMTELPETA